VLLTTLYLVITVLLLALPIVVEPLTKGPVEFVVIVLQYWLIIACVALLLLSDIVVENLVVLLLLLVACLTSAVSSLRGEWRRCC